ncbi:deoxyribonuclease-2-alpha-like [Pholidichthys leucotaenia]
MAKYAAITTFLLGTGILFHGCNSAVRCRNDSGDEVDWYILYKLPNSKTSGLKYFYMDDSTNGWKFSNEEISSSSGALGQTLKPLFDFYVRKTTGFGYMLYNDQPPPPYKTASSSYGHSKGVVMLDRQTGVWLSHSTPKFPSYRRRDFWPTSGSDNAQTFMCVTYSYDQFKEIGLQLKYIHPYSFDFDIPQTFHNELRCVAQRVCYPKSGEWVRLANLTSMAHREFLSFAKYNRFEDDLYSGLIVKHMNLDLFAKSWGRMRQPLPSYCICDTPHVYNVEKVNLMMPYSTTVDHSKWSVTSDGSWTCIADMNREKSQMKRGGGAICTEDRVVGTAFLKLISKYEYCQPLTLTLN